MFLLEDLGYMEMDSSEKTRIRRLMGLSPPNLDIHVWLALENLLLFCSHDDAVTENDCELAICTKRREGKVFEICWPWTQTIECISVLAKDR